MRRIFHIASIFLAGLVLGSCQEKVAPVAEEISADPAFIEAEAAMKSYKIAVTSNAQWTVSIADAATWLSLDRSSGHDNATVTVRVFENKLPATREATVRFTTAGGNSCNVHLTQAGFSGGEGEDPEWPRFRIGSYNLRMSHLDTDEKNVWSVRKERLKTSLLENDFDVVGIQEVSTETQTWLDSELSAKYAFRYFSPYNKDGKGDRAQGIGFKKGAFLLSDWHYFWATDTPDEMSVNDSGTQGNFKRGGCCGILTHNATGIKLFFMNNHGCLDGESNKASAPHYVTQEKRFNPSGLPSFFVGDMNASESTDPASVYMIYTAYWQDPYKLLDSSEREGCFGTYNGFSAPNGKSRIDFVFFRGEGVTPKHYRCNNTLYGGLYPSDHFPIWAEYEIKNQ